MNNLIDLKEQLRTLEDYVGDLRCCSLEDVIDLVDTIESEVSTLSDAVCDVDDDVEDLRTALEEARRRSPFVELENLKVFHENQRKVIVVLLEIIAEARQAAQCNAALLDQTVINGRMANLGE